MSFRRVTTGIDAAGASVILSDELVAAMTLRNSSIDLLWATDEEPAVPNDGVIPALKTWYPQPGAIRVHIWTRPPDSATVTSDSAQLELGESATYESDKPGMHTTDSIDVSVVLSGELGMELDDGVATVLRRGDVVVQNGTRHRWFNDTDQPTRVLTINLGAVRTGPSPRDGK